MGPAIWIIAIELAIGLVVLGWFGLQMALLNARIMTAVMTQQGKLLEVVAEQNRTIATVRTGVTIDSQVAAQPRDPYDGAWVPPDRPVGSS